MSIDPLERGLEQSFETEKWSRFIRECDDLEKNRETASYRLQQLAQLKAASSGWPLGLRNRKTPNSRCLQSSFANGLALTPTRRRRDDAHGVHRFCECLPCGSRSVQCSSTG